MKINELLDEGYDKDHKCQTPGAIYSSKIGKKEVSMRVKLPMSLELSKTEATDLEAELHYAFEGVLKKFFTRSSEDKTK